MSTHFDKILFQQTNFEAIRVFSAKQNISLTETEKCFENLGTVNTSFSIIGFKKLRG
jgi:hypothetical protein